MSNTESTITVEWNQLNWRKIHKVVFKLQKRIYRAYINGEVEQGRRLQKTLIKSYYNRLLSVRKVSQDNNGKKTAGTDRIKLLTPKQRLSLAHNLNLGDKADPIRRVWIPKPGKDEKRPLGIPTMRDRATQALVKAALEPEWEAKFENNSYGFRPGRGAHDAIQAIFLKIRYKTKFVLDADIEKCFDKINHSKLLDKLNTKPSIRRQVRAWLKADIYDISKKTSNPNQQGTPQGGVISPLLSNIALHGMEQCIQQIKGASLIRYADDFVIFHDDLDKLKECQKIINEWLSDYDLRLKPEKTKMVHTLNELNNEKPGFNFLGFNIRQYAVGKYQSGKNTHCEPLGFKTLIKPSKESIKNHYDQIALTCKKGIAASQSTLISRLNPIIIGWCNYYKTVVSKDTFAKLGHLTYKRITRWAYKRHTNKSRIWIRKKYWRTVGLENWVFGTKNGDKLIRHNSTAIKRHIKVRKGKSPYDGNTIYWATRKGKNPELNDSIAKLLKKQNGKCKWCNLTFLEEDLIEIDHIIPKAIAGNIKDNLHLLHKQCHDIKTKTDLRNIKNHKSKKEWNKYLTQFNEMKWVWIDDIPSFR